ncbi:hypothetical protein ILUMI_11389 [Ignelater luminosus]|uniref:PiggyBac transposable element-derived protein domain-containing protein n=1 Tax=Ignelater luminosus TaxID=2038154 RepID=A0A8K0CYI0_IGNLU|nr:hypothetical protein ILUMI_11389 [Ignelater luminosus]
MDLRLVITVEEVLQMTYDDNLDFEEIYIESPEVNTFTDKDSGEEDDSLNRNQLQARTERALKVNNNLEEKVNQEIFEERPRKGDLVVSQKTFPQGNNEIIDYRIEEATKYALFLNNADTKITQNEMKCFIAILILPGYNVDYYWESGVDMRNALIDDVMRKDQFSQILKYIHCTDNNNPDKTNKLWKDKLKNKFTKNWIPEENLDFDESMIKYYGCHSSEANRFDSVIKCIASILFPGFSLILHMYLGKNPKESEMYESQFGKCIAPLITMIDEFPNDTKILEF